MADLMLATAVHPERSPAEPFRKSDGRLRRKKIVARPPRPDFRAPHHPGRAPLISHRYAAARAQPHLHYFGFLPKRLRDSTPSAGARPHICFSEILPKRLRVLTGLFL